MARKASLARISLAFVVAGLPALVGAQTPAPPAAPLTPTQPPPAATPTSTPPPANQPPPPAATPTPTPPPANQPPPKGPLTPTAPPSSAPPPSAPVPPPLPVAPPPAPVPPPLPPEPVFYYDDHGKAAGPFDLADLQAKIAAGVIGPTTRVWKSGTNNWVAAKDLPDLSPSFAPAAATPAPILPPATGQPGAATDIRTFFVGAWETDGPAPPGTQGRSKMVLSLAQDGSVQGTYSVTFSGNGATVSVAVTGTWNAAPLSDNLASLTLHLIVHGANGQTENVNSTATLQIVDQDTLRDAAQGTITKRVKP